MKICGVKNVPTLLAVNEAGADAVGFVFHKESARYVTPAEAIPLALIAGRARRKVGVFVDAPPLEMVGTAEAAKLDYVQLHGDPDAERVNLVRTYMRMAKQTIGVILGIRLDEARLGDGDGALRDGYLAEVAEAVNRCAPDLVLVEAAHATLPGGSGEAWDWAAVRDLPVRAPLLLAGGLTPENVAGAIAAARPGGVDVSTGVETDGRKDPDKIARFVAAARATETVPAGSGDEHV